MFIFMSGGVLHMFILMSGGVLHRTFLNKSYYTTVIVHSLWCPETPDRYMCITLFNDNACV